MEFANNKNNFQMPLGSAREIGKKIIEDVLKHSKNNVHPRIMLTADDYLRITTVDDKHYKTAIANVCIAADKLVAKDSSGNYEKPPRNYKVSDGIRLLPISRSVLARVQSLSMAYKLTGNTDYAKRAYAELESAASFPDWNPKHFLDVGEMCNAFAIGYDRLYDWMNESQKKILQNAIVKHGLYPIMDEYLGKERKGSFYKWYQATPGTNWKFVCSGGVSNAALAICDEPGVNKDLCADVLGYAFKDIYDAVRNLYPKDGSFDEGFTYWTYASNYLAFYTSALVSAAGTEYGITNYKPLKDSAYYVKNISSNTLFPFNFGDAEEVPLKSEVLLWYGKTFDAPDLAGIRVNVFGSVVSYMDLLWYNHSTYSRFADGALTYAKISGTEASFRSGWSTDDLYGAIHFGNNNVSHTQSDTGTFVVEYGGKRFFNDLGQDNYNVEDYTKAYRYRTEGHNTISLRKISGGSWDNQNKYSFCLIDSLNDEPGKNNFVISDISEAYSGKGVARGMMMTADKKAIIVQDKLTPGTEYEGYWFAHTKGVISLASDKRSAVVDVDGVKLLVQIISEGHTFGIMDAKQMDDSIAPHDQFNNSEYKKLAIKFTGDNEISVAFIPLSSNDDNTVSVPEFKTITSW